MMRFRWTILYVEDVERSVSFYEAALGLQRRFVHESGQFAEMETGETALAFASVELIESELSGGFRKNVPAGPPAGIEIAFVAPDVEAAFRTALDAGATRVSEPETKPWGQTVAYVRDPDGVLIEIATEVQRLAEPTLAREPTLLGAGSQRRRGRHSPIKRLPCIARSPP